MAREGESAAPAMCYVAWAGDTSRQYARILRGALELIIQSVDYWTSDVDIGAGQVWLQKLLDALARSRFGILCLTPDAMDRPWIGFEAGALAHALIRGDDRTRVVPLLFGGLRPSDLKPPLSLLQAREADRDGLWDTVAGLNAGADRPLAEEVLRRSFDAHADALIANLNAVKAKPVDRAPPVDLPAMLQELIGIARTQDASLSTMLARWDKVLQDVRYRPLAEALAGQGAVRHRVLTRPLLMADTGNEPPGAVSTESSVIRCVGDNGRRVDVTKAQNFRFVLRADGSIGPSADGPPEFHGDGVKLVVDGVGFRNPQTGERLQPEGFQPNAP